MELLFCIIIRQSTVDRDITNKINQLNLHQEIANCYDVNKTLGILCGNPRAP